MADVDSFIIGADFIKHFGLIIDLKKDLIIDSLNKQSISCKQSTGPAPQIRNLEFSEDVASVLKEFSNVFKRNSTSKQIPSSTTHSIITTKQPVFAKLRPLNPCKLQAAKKEFQYLLENGICRPSSSNWASPLHLVIKKDGSFRPCGDYRALNAQTVPDRYPLPFINDVSAMLHSKKVFSKIDLERAFNQIPIREEDIPKTASTTPFGLFEFCFMTFGLRNAAQTFQRIINEALSGLDFVFAYVDDILVASDNVTQHKRHLQLVFQRLR